MLQKNCTVWLTLLTCGFYMHSVDGSNQTQQNTACDAFGTCSQLCTTNADQVICSCADGFKLKENGWGCSPLDSNWKIVGHNWLDEWCVLSMWKGETKSETKITIAKGLRPYGITYDARNNEIYTTRYDDDHESLSVFRTSLGNGSSVKIFTGYVLSHNLAFDWTTGNIYFADTLHSRITLCNANANVCGVLIDESVKEPEHIALHPASGLLFWTEKGIKRAGMDGSRPHKIVSFESSEASGLTVDQANERLYFAVGYYLDSTFFAIQSSRFDGSDQKIAISREIAGIPIGLNVLGERLIWYNYGAHSFMSTEKFNGSNKQVHMSDIVSRDGFVVFHLANQPITKTSPCSEANCSHICTLGSQENFKCFCPAGMQLAADGKRCTDDVPKLVVASEGTFKTTTFGRIEKEGWEVTHLDPKINFIADITYNPINHTLILSDSVSKRIHEYSLNSKKLSVLVDGHLDKVQSLDIDVVGGNLYWADSGKNTIEVMSLRTSARGVISRNLTNIRDFVVVPDTGSLYVLTKDAEGGKIIKMLLAGGNASVDPFTYNPVALSYERQLGRIFCVERLDINIYTNFELKLSSEENSSDWMYSSYNKGGIGCPPSGMAHYKNFGYYACPDYIQVIDGKPGLQGGSWMSSKLPLGSFDRNSSFMPPSIDVKMTVIDRNLSSLEGLLTHHDCGIKNPTKLNCSHLCLLTGEKLVGSCSCPEGMILDEDKKTCKSLSICYRDQFTCNSNNKCKSDCDNGEDENNCEENTCTAPNFKCATSGKCIPGDWVCDEDHDCVGGDDELHCTSSCDEDREFTCESTKKCIPRSSRCDGVVDCLEDDSDEQGCLVTSCGNHQLRCQSGLCIEKDLLCNGVTNCDVEDEINCTGVVGEPPGEEKPTPAVNDNIGTPFAVMMIVVLLTLVLIALPLGVIIVRWSIHKFFMPARPVVKKRIVGSAELDDTTELSLEQNVDGECMETDLTSKIARDSSLDGCPTGNILSDSRDFQVENVGVAEDTEDRGHHFVSFSDMEKLISSTATNNEVDTRPLGHNHQS